MPEVIRCALLFTLEAVEGRLCLMETMRCVLGTRYARNVEGGLYLLEMMRRVLLCMLEIVEVPETLETMRCMLLRKYSRLWRVQNDEEAI